MSHNQRKHQSIEREPEITDMTEWADEDFKVTIINILKDLKDNMKINGSELEDIKNQI